MHTNHSQTFILMAAHAAYRSVILNLPQAFEERRTTRVVIAGSDTSVCDGVGDAHFVSQRSNYYCYYITGCTRFWQQPLMVCAYGNGDERMREDMVIGHTHGGRQVGGSSLCLVHHT